MTAPLARLSGRYGRAIVIGGSFAGLAAAAALRPACTEVLVIERDSLPDTPSVRRGVPQGDQLHNLLGCAQLHLERLLPGFRHALLAAGAAEATVAAETHVYELGVRMPERDLGLRLMCAPRPVIDQTVTDLLLREDGVSIRDGCTVRGLTVDASGTCAGVIVDNGEHVDQLDADLVIDASGSASLARQWLTEAGFAAPAVEVAEVRQWYVSLQFRRPPEWTGRPDFWLTFPSGDSTSGGLVSPTGDRAWTVSVSGTSDDPPPRTTDDFLDYVRSLEDPAIGEVLSQATPIGTPRSYRKPTATWKRYDRLADPLAGFLPLGDAVACLNPLFGQGMSVAAWQAATLADLTASGPDRTGLGDLTRSFHRAAAAAADAAWRLGQLGGRPLFPDEVASTGSRGSRRDRAFAELLRVDPDLHRRYVSVWHLLEPLDALAEAELVARIDREAALQEADR